MSIRKSVYQEFKSNPWNFLSKRLKVVVNEKELEESVKYNLSDLNYRNLLLYQNNGLIELKEDLNYERLIDVNSITVIIYLFDLDTFIIENPFNIERSCISKLTIINPKFSQSDIIVKDSSCYGLDNVYYIINRDFKLIYNPKDSKTYIEGNSNSKFWFFKNIKYFNCLSSIRIYSTKDILSFKDIWKSSEIMPSDVMELNNTVPLYPQYQLRTRLIESKSYGLYYLKEFLESDPEKANEMLMNEPIYKTGISVIDLNHIKEILKTFNIGKDVDFSYKVNSKAYRERLENYGFIGIFKDALVGLFFNSNSKKPFLYTSGIRTSTFFYLNHYCFFIGRCYDIYYTFNKSTILLDEFYKHKKCSILKITLKENKSSKKNIIDVNDSNNDNEMEEEEINDSTNSNNDNNEWLDLNKDFNYELMGSWKKVCNKDLLPNDNINGKCKILLYKETNNNLNLVI